MTIAVLDFYTLVWSRNEVLCNSCNRVSTSLCCRYDPKENKWTRVASMSTRRLGVAVAVLGGFLYAVGGSDGTSPLNTGEALVHV